MLAETCLTECTAQTNWFDKTDDQPGNPSPDSHVGLNLKKKSVIFWNRPWPWYCLGPVISSKLCRLKSPSIHPVLVHLTGAIIIITLGYSLVGVEQLDHVVRVCRGQSGWTAACSGLRLPAFNKHPLVFKHLWSFLQEHEHVSTKMSCWSLKHLMSRTLLCWDSKLCFKLVPGASAVIYNEWNTINS